MLEKYKVILWDFDGVLMDSNSVRDMGFERVLSEYPQGQVEELMKYHRANGGLSRYVKFRYFFEEVLKEKISEEEILVLADRFSTIMKSLLLNPHLLIQDSLTYVKNQYELDTRMHIVSGSDQTELRYLCNELNIAHYFVSIHGSPTPKPELVKHVLEKNAYTKKDVVLIGDSINDYDAAMRNTIDFLGYNNTDLRQVSVGYIENFNKAIV